MAMPGAALAVDRHEHMKRAVFLPLLPDLLARAVEVAGQVLVVLARLIPVAIDYAWEESYVRSPALGLPLIWRAPALPVRMGSMLILMVLSVIRTKERAVFGGRLILAGAVSLLMFWAKSAMLTIGDWNLRLWLRLFAGRLLLSGVPITFCFALGTLAYVTFATRAPVFVMMGRIDEGMSSLILLSVPVSVLPAAVPMPPAWAMFPIARSLGIHDIHYSMAIAAAMNIGLDQLC